jgi:hypothetical protein
MAQKSTLATGQNGSHPPPVHGKPCVAHGVDATVNAMQPATLDAVVDGVPRESGRQQLPACYNAVLMRGELGDCPLVRAAGIKFAAYITVNLTRAGHGPNVGSYRRAG